jgi:hypothetical protein
MQVGDFELERYHAIALRQVARRHQRGCPFIGKILAMAQSISI